MIIVTTDIAQKSYRLSNAQRGCPILAGSYVPELLHVQLAFWSRHFLPGCNVNPCHDRIQANLGLLVLLSGPNGAGKTTFINRFLRQRAEAFRFVNPDEVARGLAGEGAARDLAAGRLVLERLDALFVERADVVLETTLATRSHAPRIRRFKAAGYRVELIYLRPPSADFSVDRVARRVAQGGHGIPEDTLRRRFALSLDYLETVYKPLVDSWEVYASSDEGLELLEMSPR